MQLTLFTHSYTTFSHTLKNKFITDNFTTQKEDDDSARTDKAEQHSTAAAPCSSVLFRTSWGKPEIYINLLYCNVFPCMLFR